MGMAIASDEPVGERLVRFDRRIVDDARELVRRILRAHCQGADRTT